MPRYSTWSHRWPAISSNWPRLGLLLAITAPFLFASGGCGLFRGPHAPTLVEHAPVPLANPLPLPPGNEDFVWNQIVDTIDDYFRIRREQRPYLEGGVLARGIIETRPQPAATYFEPWRQDSAPGYERLHATLQTIRRQATVVVSPTASGYQLEVVVRKFIEDLAQPLHSTVSGIPLRHNDGFLDRPNSVGSGYVDGTDATNWINIGRDVALEQQILLHIQKRITDK